MFNLDKFRRVNTQPGDKETTPFLFHFDQSLNNFHLRITHILCSLCCLNPKPSAEFLKVAAWLGKGIYLDFAKLGLPATSLLLPTTSIFHFFSSDFSPHINLFLQKTKYNSCTLPKFGEGCEGDKCVLLPYPGWSGKCTASYIGPSIRPRN